MSVEASYTVTEPAVAPGAPSAVAGRAIFEWCSALLRIGPPWLQRVVGTAVMKGMGESIDTEQNRSVEGLELRFPSTLDPDALGLLGRERRILRGPGELDATFALRLRGFWDAHRTRGNADALLRQMYEFFLVTNNVPIQYVANSGTSVTIDAGGAITRSTVAGWSGDGEYPTKWARYFLIFYFDGDTFEEPLTDENGDPLLTEDGELLLASTPLDSLSSEQLDIICSVPREWSAAHIDRVYIVLLPLGGYVWGLPPGIAWGDGKTWGGGGATTFTC